MEKWLRLEEAASVLRVKRETLRKWIVAGKVRGQKLGRSWRVHHSEIARLLPAPPEDEPQA